MTKLSLGFSPCPNDTFIFDALVNKKIDTPGFDFEPVLEDVETLNKWALQGKLDMTKISFGVLPLLSGKYELLDSGAALGKGVGPLLIAREPIDPTRIREKNVAIPGENTTANLLFSLAFPDSTKKKFMVFSAIEDAVLSGETDCGVIIHENRFTYEKRGLRAIMDLGDYWERKTACPVPLGGIVMRRRFSAESRLQVSAQIKKSIENALRPIRKLQNTSGV